MFFNASNADDPENIQEKTTSVILPNFDSGSVTNMPNPKARRSVPTPVTTTNIAAEDSAQIEDNSSISSNTPSDQEAKILMQTAPEYPSSALRKNESGTVLLRVTIDEKGEVQDTSIETSSSSRILDRAARKSVSKWKFSPKIENGIAVTSDLLIPIEYKSE